jgi:hypothetical protein
MVANADHDALAQLEFDLLRPAARARHELVMARHALIAVVFALLYNNVIETELVVFALLAGIYLAASHAIDWQLQAAVNTVQERQ